MEPRAVEVIAPGARTTVQDLGRPGHASIGVGPSGAADRGALRLANRLAGNDEGAPALEVVLGGLVLEASAPCRVVVTGAVRPVRLRGRAAAMHAPLQLGAGDRIEIGSGGAGVYTYVALDGGVAATPVLGSASTDVLGGIGPDPLVAGQALPLGAPRARFAVVDQAPVRPIPANIELRVLPGPRADRLAPDAFRALCATDWQVSAASNRVALRLDGTALAHAATGELPSEGLVRGAVQVPPDGQPVVFGPDHPTTGGYPVLAVVIDADLDAAAQAAPGARVRFRPHR